MLSMQITNSYRQTSPHARQSLSSHQGLSGFVGMPAAAVDNLLGLCCVMAWLKRVTASGAAPALNDLRAYCLVGNDGSGEVCAW